MFTFPEKKIMAKKEKFWPSVIAFRITDEDREVIDEITEKLQVTKSEFFRERFRKLLTTNTIEK
jgi:hypothetical protein